MVSRTQLLRGFSMLELMIVLGIIAILAMIALPSQVSSIQQKRILETLQLAEPLKGNIFAYYMLNGDFPEDNEAAGLPEPEKILGNYLQRTTVEDGVIHLHLGQKLPDSLTDKIISIRPIVVEESPASPISWICGYDEIPEGMNAQGENKTDVPRNYLPLRCR